MSMASKVEMSEDAKAKAQAADKSQAAHNLTSTSSNVQLVKSNVLHIDGTDLRLCCLVELHPEPFRVQLSRKMTTLKALTHTDQRNDLYSQYLRELIFQLYLVPGYPASGKVPMIYTIWYYVQQAFGFQPDNLYNQFEDVTHGLLIMSLREFETSNKLPSFLGLDTTVAVLEEYHAKLFENYMKWADYMRLPAFPWASDASKLPWNQQGLQHETRSDISRMVTEVAIFKMMWGEASNLRHTPEFLNFLFHWGILAYNNTRRRPVDGVFLDVVTAAVQRLRDEAWYIDNPLRPADHSRRLYYDDVNEYCWERSATRWLKRLEDRGDIRLSGHHCQQFLNYMAKASSPGQSVKTFAEKRSYAQFFSYYAGLGCYGMAVSNRAQNFSNEWSVRWIMFIEPASVVQKNWGLTVVLAICLSATKPLLELSLFELRSLRKLITWGDLLRTSVVNLVRLGFLGLAVFVLWIDPKGLASPHFAWDGIIGFSYIVFYVAHGAFPFLHIRIFHRMPFFTFVWSIPGLRWALGPRKYLGSPAFLAEDLSAVLHYILFWSIPLVCKCVFWFFGILPLVLESGKLLNTVEPRPVYFYDFALFHDEQRVYLKILFWVPVYLFWYFDTQIFFLLYGSAYATLLGYLHRVGYIQEIKTIQQRLFPLIPAKVLFAPDVGSMAVDTETTQQQGGHHKRSSSSHRNSSNLNGGQRGIDDGCVSQRSENQYSHRFRYGRQSSQASGRGLRTPQSASLTTGTPASSAARRITYANASDPYARMANQMNAAGLAEYHHTRVSGPIDQGTRLRKCFGFVWNEIVQSWRLEDIISNEELLKLQFNELPGLSARSKPQTMAPSQRSCHVLGLHRWLDLRTQNVAPLWNRSIARLPVYVYSDVIVAFLKACENYQLQLNDPNTRLRSRATISRRFFEKHLSPDVTDQLNSNMRSSLPLEGLREVVEAFFMYLSRYFEQGAAFVEEAENLWAWLRASPSRLSFFNLLALRELHKLLLSLFTEAQGTRDIQTIEARRREIQDLHQQLRKTLEQLIAVLPGQVIPKEIQSFLAALNRCFSSTLSIASWCEPPALSSPEVNSLSLKIQQMNWGTASPLTGSLGLFGAGDVFAPYIRGTGNQQANSTLSRETIVELRGMYRLESGAFLPRDIDGVLRLYFRRACRILSVTEARLKSSEAQRRFTFFMNSLLMCIPNPPEVLQMVSMCTLTPYYRECCTVELQGLLEATTDGGIAPVELLRSLMPEEFEHFIERVDRSKAMFRYHQRVASRVQQDRISHSEALLEIHTSLGREKKLFHYIQFCKQLQNWASNRSQVLSRTVRGMMYYETAVQIQNYVETRDFAQLHLCHDLNRLSFEQQQRLFCPESALWRSVLQLPPPYLFAPSVKVRPRSCFHEPFLQSLARLKFHYIVAAQEFGADKHLLERVNLDSPTAEVRAALSRRNGILELLRTYGSLRLASLEDEIDESGCPTGRRFSVLYRWVPRLHSSLPGQSRKPLSVPQSVDTVAAGVPFNPFPAIQRANHNDDDNVSHGGLTGQEFPEGEEDDGQDEEHTCSTEGEEEHDVEESDFGEDSTHDDVTMTQNVSLSGNETEGTSRTGHEAFDRAAAKVSTKKWFKTETRQMACPPAVNASVVSDVSDYLITPSLDNIPVEHPPIQYQRFPQTPGALEACTTPEANGHLEFENDDGSASISKSCVSNNGRQRTFIKYTSPPSKRYFKRHMDKSSSKEGSNYPSSLLAGGDRSSPGCFTRTPLVGRDNDILLSASPKCYSWREEVDYGVALSIYGGREHSSTSPYLLLDGELQAVYKILLPPLKGDNNRLWARNPIIGHGKPENQNHAMIFTRGETIQAIDMNMDGYLEESMKLRNLLQEFTAHPRMRILGFREHIFSHNVSSISSFMALQELTFVTNNQRLYHTPLRTRMHYGHPDIFDRFFVQCCGSMSKASNGINVSEDVFAGYNATQRGFTLHHVDYHQVGKGRDVGLQQIFMFEKKVAGGNAEQMLSRDLRRLFDGMDFFRMMSLFFSGPGLFLNALILIFAVFAILYGRVLLSFTRMTCVIMYTMFVIGSMTPAPVGNHWSEIIAPVTTVQLQLGMFLILPIILLIALERGLWQAAKQFFTMIIKFAALYYNFMVGTKAAVLDGVLIYGGAKYQATGRGFQIAHVNLATLWRFYCFTHFEPAVELLLLLCLYSAYGGLTPIVYILDTWPLWLVYASFAWTPFLFNPLGIFYPQALQDLKEFNRWMMSEVWSRQTKAKITAQRRCYDGRIMHGCSLLQDLSSEETSWRAWWRGEADSYGNLWWHNKALVLVRHLRYFFLAFGLACLVAQRNNQSDIDVLIYVVTSFLTLGILILFMHEFKLVNPAMSKFLGFVVVCVLIGTLVWLISAEVVSIATILASILAFVILVYGTTQVVLVLTSRWGVRNAFIDAVMRSYHLFIAHIIFFPVILFASITLSFHEIQTRVLFNPRFVGVVKTGLIQQAVAAKKG